MIKKQEKLFNLNNVLISIYGEKSSIGKLCIEENEAQRINVTKSLIDDFEDVKNGAKNKPADIPIATKESASKHLLDKNYSKAFYAYAQLFKDNSNDIDLIILICNILMNLNGFSIIKKHFLKKLIEYENDNIAITHIIAKTYVKNKKKNKSDIIKACSYFEKLVQQKDVSYDILLELAWIYENIYQDKHIDKQLLYTQKALKSAPSNQKEIIKLFLAKLYSRNGQKKEAELLFKEILSDNPSVIAILAYSNYLVSEGDLINGFDKYRLRFKDKTLYPIALKEEKRWDGEQDLSNSKVIIHYEQGFGDTVMFSRYVKYISQMAKETVFIVQNNLLPLFKSSGFGEFCTLLPHYADIDPKIKKLQKTKKTGEMYVYGSGMFKIEHDYHIPLLDCPYLLKETKGKIKDADGFLKIGSQKINKYRKKYIKNTSKLKIGISYHGAEKTIFTYRDVPLKHFLPIFKLENVEIYGFQVDKHNKELYKYMDKYNIYDLGKTFKNFEDTACAIECMDLIISTDNVIMNLAGALGKKTYGLFNVYPEFRWYKTDGEDIDWYKTVKPFRAETYNDWDNLIRVVKSQIIEDFNLYD